MLLQEEHEPSMCEILVNLNESNKPMKFTQIVLRQEKNEPWLRHAYLHVMAYGFGDLQDVVH